MKYFSYITFMLIMICLGASDSLRGVFAPVFKDHFQLTSTGFSLIVTVSYFGNLFFLLIGSRLADCYGKKTVSSGVLLLWIFSLLLYIGTDSFPLLLVSMFICMGTSTLMNTMINILTPLIFAYSPVLIVNTLFFVQGIGTSGFQAFAGRIASSFFAWKIVNLVLLIIGLIGFIFFRFLKIPESSNLMEEKNVKIDYKKTFCTQDFLFLCLMFGFYFVAEHGVLNYLVLYGLEQFSLPQKISALYLSFFFGGITVGRLIFAPFVQKKGATMGIKIFGLAGTILYCVGIFCTSFFYSSRFLMILAFSGLVLSILYPTMLLFIRNFYSERIISTVTGSVISVATFFDIGFNLIFGRIVDIYGYSKSILILPSCMILFFVSFSLCSKKLKKRECSL